jgi:hypothetical protein
MRQVNLRIEIAVVGVIDKSGEILNDFVTDLFDVCEMLLPMNIFRLGSN